jgi:hypothetical protein
VLRAQLEYLYSTHRGYRGGLPLIAEG